MESGKVTASETIMPENLGHGLTSDTRVRLSLVHDLLGYVT